jgi:hypothetical protein
VPTKWFITALSTLFLVASAAFGGLAAVPTPPLPTIEPGSTFAGTQLDIAVSAAVLIDAFPEQGIEPTPGNRLLVVRAIVENVWDFPVSTMGGVGAADNLRVVGANGVTADGLSEDTPPFAVAIVSDGSQQTELQPGVPVELAYIWQVPSNALADAAQVRVAILDKVYHSGGQVAYGENFADPFVAAYTEVAVTDVGAGMGAPTESGQDE